MRGRKRLRKKKHIGTIQHQRDPRLEWCPVCRADETGGWAFFVQRRGEIYEVDDAIFCFTKGCANNGKPHTIRSWLHLHDQLR